MSTYSLIGKRLARPDSLAKAVGDAKYVADMSLPGMLHGKILRSPHAHARILNIDTSQAERLPGVKAVITGKDTVGHKWGVFPFSRDQQMLTTEKIRYIGEEVAAVAAIDEDIAEEALGLIKVDYEVLPSVFDPEEAMKDGAPQLHDDKPNNISTHVWVDAGDVEKALKESYCVQEARFTSPEEMYMQVEPYCVLASFDSTGLHLWVNSAGHHMKSRPLSTALGIPLNETRLHSVVSGGHFGGRSEISPADFIASLLAIKSRRPVKLVYTHEENCNCVRQVHAFIANIKLGVEKDGTFTAADFKCILDGGAYTSTGPIATSVPYLLAETVYRFPNFRYDGYRAYTNKTPRGMYPQHARAFFAGLEMVIDMIAEKLGMDSAELRLKNAVEANYTSPTGQRITSCGLKEAIQKVIERTQWTKKREKLPPGRGIGISCLSMMCGLPMGIRGGSAAFIKFNEDGEATVFSGVMDNGQGNDSMVIQIVAEELGLPVEKVKLVCQDTLLTDHDQGSYTQASTLLSGGAAKRAASDAKRQLLEVAAKGLGVKVDDLEARNGLIYVRDNPEKSMSHASAIRAARANNMTITGRGERWPPGINRTGWLDNPRGKLSHVYSFASNIAEVEVDTETGKIKVLNITIAQDCGYPLNPMAVEGQLHRSACAAVQGALLERVLWDNGQVLNANFLDYWFPLATDMPKVDTILVETNDPFGPFGAKEAGLAAAMAVSGSIANAVHNAIGVWIKELPITPDKVLKALEERRRTK